MRLCLTVAVLCSSSVALAQAGGWDHPLPRPDEVSLAKDLKRSVDGLLPRVKQEQERLAKVQAALAKAGVRYRDATEEYQQDRAPTPGEMTPIAAEMQSLDADAKQLETDCKTYEQGVEKLNLREGLSYTQSQCVEYFESVHQPGDCGQWQQLKIAFWPEKGACHDTPRKVQRTVVSFQRYKNDWDRAQQKEAGLAAQDAVISQPVSGNPLQRAVPIPRKFLKPQSNGQARLDARGLFAATHPSHFVFLRKDFSEAPPEVEDQAPHAFSRTLKKGEAVLPLRTGPAGEGYVSILSIDGNRGVVKAEDLAVAPLPRTKVAPLTARDLNVFGDDGKVLAGPAWLAPDATGFDLDEPNGWLDLLDPPEPRSQKFLEAKEKVLGCYNKQMHRLDPHGELRKYYDVVTFGRSGEIIKTESAAVKFDRQACAACGCKAFNRSKAKLIEQAIAPAQKEAFKAYQPLVDQLNRTDFANAARGAPRGDQSWVSHGI